MVLATLGSARNIFQAVIPRLGGGALIALTLLLFGRVAHDAAVGGRGFSSIKVFVAAIAIVEPTAVTFDLQPLSPRALSEPSDQFVHPQYRGRSACRVSPQNQKV